MTKALTPLLLLALLPAHAQEGAEVMGAPLAAEPTAVGNTTPAPVAEEPLPIPPAAEDTIDATAPMEAPTLHSTEDIPAPTPTPQDADEQLIHSGLAELRSIAEALDTVRNAPTADDAAKAIIGVLDRLREWHPRLQALLQDPAVAETYTRDYRPAAEKLCLALAEYSVRLVDASCYQSDDLHQALLRMAQELPTAFELRENARWTCTGIILLSMLDDALAGISSTPTATKYADRVQQIVDAMQPWRQASRPAGAATATRRYLKGYQSFVDREDLRLQMQAKRITYADFFSAENLALPILQATDTLADVCAFPAEERHIRTGIVLLGVLENILAQVKDTDSARASTTPIVRLSNELQQWGQAFAALPEPDEATIQRYEKRYLPRIEQLNDRIKSQGARIASAEFYRSRELPMTLLRLLMNFQ